VLYVDLTSGESRKEPLSTELIQGFLGGYGINNRLAFELISPQVDPLSPENRVILGAGPFCGTLVPGSAKIMATTRFPLNGAFATAAAGGALALRLKSVGYDHVVISGRASQPVFLKISEAGGELADARHLWGKDNFETDAELRSRFEPCSIIPIGPAGERQVRCSVTWVDKLGTLGRGGLPAVMGAKNLKAIVVLQGTHPIQVAHPLQFMRLVNELHQRILRWQGRPSLLEVGMSFGAAADLSSASPEVQQVHREVRKYLACPSCPLADKTRVSLREGKYAGVVTYMPHLWVEPFFGEDAREQHDKAVKYDDTLNRYGLCHMTFTYLFTYLCRLYREGIITREDTGGLELREDLETALLLAKLTSYREGWGDLLAEGPVAVARQLGRAAEELLDHIKGQSVVFDARRTGLGTMEFEQMVNPRGAHVASGGSPSYDRDRPPQDFARHGERMGASPEALRRAVDATGFHPGRFTKFSEDWYALFSCLGLCNRAFVNRFYHVNTLAELYSALTGRETSSRELMRAAERAWNMGKWLNVRAGFSRQDDRPPRSWLQPLEHQGEVYQLTDYYHTRVITGEDLERYLDDYYRERGYDVSTGIPQEDIRRELDLE
jgi:aldehyde:ferredoxin oxidoreductase